MHKFDPLTIPLNGQQLIEASAGTGKTYSIAQLYLRFILEEGLDVDKILVVTFTTSATEELRLRIRSRLREALDVLVKAADGEIHSPDNVLKDMLADLQDRQQAMFRLTSSIASMDESTILTIHSFCQQILQDNAFESGTPFDVELIESEHQLRLEIMNDFWRQRFYPAPSLETEWAAATWGNPLGLVKVLTQIMSHSEVRCIPEVTVKDLEEVQLKLNWNFQTAMDIWRQESECIIEILEHDDNLTRNVRSYRADRIGNLLVGMEKLETLEMAPLVLPECTELLAESVMANHTKKNKKPPEHGFFSQFEKFYQANREYTRLVQVEVLGSAYLFLKEELGKRKREHAQMYFDDLLTGLDKALTGPMGKGLIHRIRERFTVALVDEFQDTDPVQYRIFNTVFGKGPNSGLFMIGDPKQSIYSFRGADVFAYIRAKRDTMEHSAAFTMDTNYRSTSAMTRAINMLFDREGSFVFDDISFNTVRSWGGADENPFIVNGISPAAFQVMFLKVDAIAAEKKKDISKERAAKAVSSWTAKEIARLLNLGEHGEARIGKRSLSGGDIAVLVRTHREAEMIQQELARSRIASVYYSQDSVFSTDEARELYHVLRALLDLTDTSRINTALATPLYGMDAHDLEQLSSDTSRWDEIIVQLEEGQYLWRNKGIAVMLQNLFNEQRVVQRLIDAHDGERKLTNYIHLAELLQTASEDQLGMDGLVRWFANQRIEPDETNANQQLRLESDENLVRIVTVHKAKGLEYPIVFLPFVWSCQPVDPKKTFSFHLPPDNNLVFDIGSLDEENAQLADRERLAEDLRLLYVGLTRARYCCYFGWGKISRMEKSAMAWLMHRQSLENEELLTSFNEERILQELETLNEEETLLEFLPFPDRLDAKALAVRDVEKVLVPRQFHGKLDTSWTISSYSKMVRASVQMNSADEVEYVEPYPPSDLSVQSVFSFPRGAVAGTCLHSILEEIDFPDCTDQGLEQLVHEQLRMSGLDEKWSRLVCGWVKDVLRTPIDMETGLRLQDLQGEDRLAEMGFYFTIDHLEPLSFNRVLMDYGFSPIEMNEQLAGLMRGYIDLIFRFKDRYYLADYKSNYLGSSIDDYHPARLVEAMKDHRYDLQYLIYTVALHRYLATRIKGYDYESHFGGVFYFFLRGMHPDHPSGSGIFSTIPSWEMIDRLDNCFGHTGAS